MQYAWALAHLVMEIQSLNQGHVHCSCITDNFLKIKVYFLPYLFANQKNLSINTAQNTEFVTVAILYKK